jgi:hypothetical protein
VSADAIKVFKGELYFPSLDAALAFAAHCCINVRPQKSIRGWSIPAPQQKARS